jgi:hypothetical protein
MNKNKNIKHEILTEMSTLKAEIIENISEVQSQIDKSKEEHLRSNDMIAILGKDIARHDLIIEAYKRNIKELYE